MTAKDTVKALLERLPDECSLNEVLYRLDVLQAVAHGDAHLQAGRTIPHEQAAKNSCDGARCID